MTILKVNRCVRVSSVIVAWLIVCLSSGESRASTLMITDTQVQTGDIYGDVLMIAPVEGQLLTLQMSGGEIEHLQMYNKTQLLLSDGKIHSVLLQTHSRAEIRGGLVGLVNIQSDIPVEVYDGTIGELRVSTNATAEVYGGEFTLVKAGINGKVTIDGGLIEQLTGHFYDEITFNDGVAENIFIGELADMRMLRGNNNHLEDMQFNMNGGSIAEIIVRDFANLTMADGHIGHLEAGGNPGARIDIRGGVIDWLSMDYGCNELNLYGGQIGELQADYPTHLHGYGMRLFDNRVTGFWADGQPFDISLIDLPGSNTAGNLVLHHNPEPASLLLIVAGGSMLLKRK